jgi:rsbT co-antagonist protein RsbR
MESRMATATLYRLIEAHEAAILDEWLAVQRTAKTRSGTLGASEEHAADSAEFLRRLLQALAATPDGGTTSGAAWNEVRELLGDISRARARHGFTPTETATFIFSLKQPLFARLRATVGSAEELASAFMAASRLLDELGLYTTEIFQQSREAIIARQQQELLELSTPVTRLWEGILAVPLVGTLDSARTQVVMESLLQEIVSSGASIAVMDITGVPTVDTLVAQHLLKTVAAAKLMGADCIISGIRPQIAQTIVHLGVDLGDVVTKATLADAFRHALLQLGLEVRPIAG